MKTQHSTISKMNRGLDNEDKNQVAKKERNACDNDKKQRAIEKRILN